MTSPDKLVHLSGPPGSGRTTMLILKARKFLKEDSSHDVIVLNMYRGAKGRPVGWKIHEAIASADSSRTHRIEIDVDKWSSSDFVKDIERCVNCREDTDNLLFVIDEILPEEYCQDLWETLTSHFKDSWIWCADGLIPVELNQFNSEHGVKLVQLDSILRIPPSVQSVLYHAGWQQYKPDAEMQHAVPTNGPTPVRVQHEKDHGNGLIKDCTQCSDELVKLLKRIMKTTETGPSAQGASSEPSCLPCSIVILFSVPRDQYEDATGNGNDYIETTVEKFQKYVANIRDCAFIRHLKNELSINVKFAEMNENLEKEELWNKVLVSWTDLFQGLERDVVIFLPGDKAKKESRYKLRSLTATETVVTESTPNPPLSVRPGQPRTQSPTFPRKEARLLSQPQRPCSPQPSTSKAEERPQKKGTMVETKAEPSTSKPFASGWKIPVPGLATAMEKETVVTKSTPNPPSSVRPGQPSTQSPTSPRLERCLPSQPQRPCSRQPSTLKAEERPQKKGTMVEAKAKPEQKGKPTSEAPSSEESKVAAQTGGMARYYWRVDDMNHYTDWDKTNLVFAATRCTAQLILLVP